MDTTWPVCANPAESSFAPKLIDPLKTTESESPYQDIDKMSVREILRGINREDQSVAHAVAGQIEAIESLAQAAIERLQRGGRMFYLGAGTSGRLGVVDASELPPTFGASPDWVVGLIAGGDGAIRRAVEFAEDDPAGGWRDLQEYGVSSADLVVGIAASGTTPYVVGALARCREAGIATGCIVCNRNSPLEEQADYPVVAVVGPEFITGSTRMKAGTAQKLILNMLSTTVMVKLGRVEGNKMVDMQINNQKLMARGTAMIQEATGWDAQIAQEALQRYGSVRAALKAWRKEKP